MAKTSGIPGAPMAPNPGQNPGPKTPGAPKWNGSPPRMPKGPAPLKKF